MKKGLVTIKDIAKELRISPSTVSRALKDHPDISDKTKVLVNALAKEWNYKPNALALSLRNNKSNVIGVIVPEIVHHFFSSVISGIEEIAQLEGYNVMMFQSNESYQREVKNVQALLSSRVDGVLMSVSKETEKYEHLEELRDNDVPIVFFDRVCNHLSSDNVIVDDFNGAYTAVQHLIDVGCTRIAHLSAPQKMLIGQNRLKGYRKALKDNNIPLDERLVIECDDYDQAIIKMPDLLDLDSAPDGVFAVNELTAAGALAAIKAKGLNVPNDIALVGFTDGIVSRVTDPTLTTLVQHGRQVGLEAAKLLIKRIDEEGVKADPIIKVIKTHLVLRGSTDRRK